MLTGEQPGYAYSRIDNPTVTALGDAVAELHGAEAGIALATGHGGDPRRVPVASSTRATGWSWATWATGRRAPRRSPRSGGSGSRSGTSTRPTSTPSRPRSPPRRPGSSTSRPSPTPPASLADLPALAEVAHRHGALLTVDNTFASPVVCRPLEHGADLVMESATKYLSGHSDVMAGVVVGSRERVAAVRLGPDRHRRDARAVRRVPRPARDRDARRADGAPGRDGDGTRERTSSVVTGVRGVIYPGLPEPSPGGRRRADPRLGRRDAVGRPRRRPRGRARVLRRPRDPGADREPRVASTRWSSTRRRAPPLARRGRARRRGDHRGPAARVSVGLEDEADLIADFGAALEAANARRPGRAAATAAAADAGAP